MHRPSEVCLISDEAIENVDISVEFAYDLDSQYKLGEVTK